MYVRSTCVAVDLILCAFIAFILTIEEYAFKHYSIQLLSFVTEVIKAEITTNFKSLYICKIKKKDV